MSDFIIGFIIGLGCCLAPAGLVAILIGLFVSEPLLLLLGIIEFAGAIVCFAVLDFIKGWKALSLDNKAAKV